jgi:Skp family chaperone for outer membrane proteins
MARALVLGLLASFWAAPAPAQTAPAQAAPAQAPAATAAFPADARMGFVNLQVVLAKSVLGQRGSAELKAMTDQRDAELQAKQKEIADFEAKLTSPDSQAMAREAVAALMQDLNRRRAQFNFDRESWQIRVEQYSEELLGRFREQLLPVVEAVREERNLLLVFSLPTPGVIAVDPRLDLSAEVIQKLDARTK